MEKRVAETSSNVNEPNQSKKENQIAPLISWLAICALAAALNAYFNLIGWVSVPFSLLFSALSGFVFLIVLVRNRIKKLENTKVDLTKKTKELEDENKEHLSSIQNLQSQIAQLENKVNLEVDLMVRRKAFFSDVMDFADGIETLEGIQFFRYDRDRVIKDRVEVEAIKVSYLGGYLKGETESNCLISTTYYCELDLYRQFSQICQDYHRYFSARNKRKDTIVFEGVCNAAKKLHGEIKDSLQQIENSDMIDENHYIKYRIMRILYGIFMTNPNVKSRLFMQDDGERFLTKWSVEEKLLNGKKTGVWGAVMLEEAYDFPNSHIKQYRQYFCVPMLNDCGDSSADVLKGHTVAVFIYPRTDLRDPNNISSVFSDFEKEVLKS